MKLKLALLIDAAKRFPAASVLALAVGVFAPHVNTQDGCHAPSNIDLAIVRFCIMDFAGLHHEQKIDFERVGGSKPRAPSFFP